MPPPPQLKLNMCECGDLHLTYRSVTLHFGRADFLHFALQVVVWLQMSHALLHFNKQRRPPTLTVRIFIEGRDSQWTACWGSVTIME